jgi:hypothetical protein
MAKCEALQGDMEASTKHWEAALLIFQKIGVPEADEVRLSISSSLEEYASSTSIPLDKKPQPA